MCGIESRGHGCRIGADALLQLLQPDLRVGDVGGLVHGEVGTGSIVGPVPFFQATRLRFRHPRHLRFIGIKGGERLLRGAVRCESMEKVGEVGDARRPGLAAHLLAVGTHSGGKVEPQLGMRAPEMAIRETLFVGKVGQHGAPEFRLFAVGEEFRR